MAARATVTRASVRLAVVDLDQCVVADDVLKAGPPCNYADRAAPPSGIPVLGGVRFCRAVRTLAMNYAGRQSSATSIPSRPRSSAGKVGHAKPPGSHRRKIIVRLFGLPFGHAPATRMFGYPRISPAIFPPSSLNVMTSYSLMAFPPPSLSSISTI
jgi:hypothetical protein